MADSDVHERLRALEAYVSLLESILAAMLLRRSSNEPSRLPEEVALRFGSFLRATKYSDPDFVEFSDRLTKLDEDFQKLTRSLTDHQEHLEFRISVLEEQSGKIGGDESDILETLYSMSEHRTFVALPMRRLVPVTLYIRDAFREIEVRDAAGELLRQIGFSLRYQISEQYESWFGRFFARSEQFITQKEVRQRLEKVERSLELKGIDVPQSQADLNLSKAAGELMRAFEGQEHAVALIGSLCVLKRGTSSFAVSLSQEQLSKIRANPDLLKSPIAVQELIFGSSDSDALSHKHSE